MAPPSALAEVQIGRTTATSTGKLRLAVIGCGAISQSLHLPVLAGHERTRLVALVDRAIGRAQQLATGYGVPQALDDAGALRAEEVDAAIIATPAAHHAPCAIDLMQRGIHVLVEKPMATSATDAEAMVRVADETGCRLAVGYFRRLYPSLRLMKSLLDQRFLGQPLRFVAEGGGMYSWAAATLANMRRDLAGGGVLIDYGSHILDLLFYLFDEPVDILDVQDNNLGGVESDCSIHARLSFHGTPIEGSIELARTRAVGNFIRVECEHGHLVFDVNERFRLRVVPAGDRAVDPFTNLSRPFVLESRWSDASEDESWFETFRTQIDDWIDAIQHGREPRLSGRSALPTARMIERCYVGRASMSEPWVWEGVADARPARGKTVLLTGATGFIGGRAAEMLALRDGWTVRAIVHNPGHASRLARLPVELVQGDLQDEGALRELLHGCDAVVHCAVGTAWGQPRELFKVTVEGTRALAEAALQAGVGRFVHLSTISVYGDDGAMTGTIDETTPVRPPKGSEYGEHKAAAERAVLEVARRGLAATVFRPARVYGPFSRIFIERPLAAMGAGRFQWLGNPHVPADMVYVDSVAHAISLALDAPADRVAGEVFGISDGDPVTWYDFYAFFAAALGLDITRVSSVDRQTRSAERPRSLAAGVKNIVTSPEFKKLGRKVLDTDPIGTLPRWMLQRVPATERIARRMVGADDSLPVYRREGGVAGEIVWMGSGGALSNIDKVRAVLGFEPPVSRPRALELTCQWARHARIV
jgi:predicted dehydrogenase/nucleoside-diphosphate-sugar epimerase